MNCNNQQVSGHGSSWLKFIFSAKHTCFISWNIISYSVEGMNCISNASFIECLTNCIPRLEEIPPSLEVRVSLPRSSWIHCRVLDCIGILMHSKEQTTSWEAKISSAREGSRRILWNWNALYRIHNSPTWMTNHPVSEKSNEHFQIPFLYDTF